MKIRTNVKLNENIIPTIKKEKGKKKKKRMRMRKRRVRDLRLGGFGVEGVGTGSDGRLRIRHALCMT